MTLPCLQPRGLKARSHRRRIASVPKWASLHCSSCSQFGTNSSSSLVWMNTPREKGLTMGTQMHMLFVMSCLPSVFLQLQRKTIHEPSSRLRGHWHFLDLILRAAQLLFAKWQISHSSVILTSHQRQPQSQRQKKNEIPRWARRKHSVQERVMMSFAGI